ncbi:MAG: metallophosphoesterase [Sandaracinaceae bacterium]|nr:metallophosphoesterase [Sandaracinaceae bacterium]
MRQLSFARSLAVIVAQLVAACDEPRPPLPDPAPAPAPAGASFERPVDALSRPAPFDEADLAPTRTALAAAARDAALALPDFDAPGAWLVDEHPEGRLISPDEVDRRALDEEPAEGVTGERARVNPRLFRRVPVATLAADGRATVRFETARALGGASVYFGTELPDDPFGVARLRRRASALERDGEGVSVTFDVRRILGPGHDVGGARSSGRGLVRWRLEALDPERGTSRAYDDRFGFRCEPSPCGDASSFVQLPTVRLGPFVDLVGPTGATITVETDVDTVAALVVRGAGEGAPRVVRSARGGLRHELRVEGLSPATRHRYVVLVADARGELGASRSATFETWPAPEVDDRLTFAVLSDSRSGYGTAEERYAGTNRAVLEDLLLRALEEGARFVVFVGDLIDGYTTHAGAYRYELEAWQKAAELVHASIPIYETMGNHEALIDYWTEGWAVAQTGAASAESIFAERFVNPENAPSPEASAPPYAENVYSFSAGPAHLAVVNSNYFWRSHPDRADHPAFGRGQREGWVDDRQIEWLAADLAAARARGQRHLYVFTHEPGYPNGGHVQDAMWWRGRVPEVIAQRARLFGVLADREVAAIFHGDEHNYSRTRIHEGLSRPLWQVVSGGAGAPYYAQDRTVPWAADVVAFDARQHLVIVRVEGEHATARAVSRTGETMDAWDLTRADAGAMQAAPLP